MYKSNLYRFYLIILQLFIGIIEVFCSPALTYKHVNESDGMSHSQVTQILQDKHGLIWISTWNGLNLYDGERFYCFKANPGDGNPLSSNRIDQIFITSTDNIWCVTFDNDRVYLFDRSDNCFKDILSTEQNMFHVKNLYSFKTGETWLIDKNNNIFTVNDTTLLVDKAEINIKPESSVFKIIDDHSGSKWILTSEGLFAYKDNQALKLSSTPFNVINTCNNRVYLGYKDSLFCYFPKSEELRYIDIKTPGEKDITTINRTGKKIIALGGTDGFTIYDTENESASALTLPKNNLSIKRIIKDSKDNYWGLTTNGHIFRTDIKTGKTIYYYYGERQYDVNATIHIDNYGTLWIINNKGELLYYNDQDDKFYNFHATFSSIDKTNPVRRIFRDNQKNIWAVRYRGIDIITPYLLDIKSELTSHNIRALYYDNDSEFLWIGTKDNYLIIKDRNNILRYISAKGQITEEKTPFGANIYAICRDYENNIWLGTKENGIYIINNPENIHINNCLKITEIKNDPADKYSVSSNNIYSFYEDKQKRMWIATFGGGINMAQKSNDGYFFINYNNDLPSYPEMNKKARAVKSLSDSVIGIATTNGLVTFNPYIKNISEIEFFVNKRDPFRKSSLSDNNIINLLNTDKDCYILTYNGGLNRILSDNIVSDSLSFSLLGINEGAISEAALSAVQTNDSLVWITYEYGFSRFNIKSRSFENYTNNILGKNIIFTEGNVIYNGKDKIYLPSNKGLFSLDINNIKQDKYIPNLFITSINIKNKRISGNPDKIDTLVLNTVKERNISISYAAADYRHGLPREYAVFMDGLHSEWEYIGESNSVNFSNLAPGNYTLNLKSTNSNGVWKDNIRKITIIVKPKFTETNTAKLLYLIIAFILFYFGRKVVIHARLFIVKYKKAIEESNKKRLSASIIPNRPEIESNDEQFLNKLLSIVEKNIQNTDFSVEDLTSEMAMGRTSFYAKMKELLGQTPIDFIRETRIKRAMQLLESGEYNVTQVAYECGFSDPKFFSKTFKKMTGHSPKEFKNKVSEHPAI